MAFNRDKAIQQIARENDSYSDHVIKCILYKNTTNNLWHWVDEIATKLHNVNRIRLKSGSKFDRQFYINEFLLSDGDCPSDFEIVLNNFQSTYRFKYPKINITSDIVELTDVVFHDLSNYFSYILAKDNNYDKIWFRNKLLDYFEELND